MNDTLEFLTAAAIFLVVFPGFWSLIIMLASLLGGWGALARQYPPPPLAGEEPIARWYAQHLGMRWANYSWVVTMAVYPEGLHLSVMWLFRAGHPPLFIPWEEMRLEKRFMWFQHFVRVRCERLPRVVLEIPQKAADRIEAAVGKRWADGYERP